jgi:ABC-type glycerol-3-phosphate transport system permease component
MVIPLSRTNIAALFVILFIYGWNKYLWPLLISNTPSMTTIGIGIRQMIGNGRADRVAPGHGHRTLGTATAARGRACDATLVCPGTD